MVAELSDTDGAIVLWREMYAEVQEVASYEALVSLYTRGFMWSELVELYTEHQTVADTSELADLHRRIAEVSVGQLSDGERALNSLLHGLSEFEDEALLSYSKALFLDEELCADVGVDRAKLAVGLEPRLNADEYQILSACALAKAEP